MNEQEFHNQIIELDKLLTGDYSQGAENMARHQSNTESLLKRFITQSDVYYLSDGGYSRLWFSHQERCLVMCSGAFKDTRNRWDNPSEEIQALKEDIERHLCAVLDDEELLTKLFE